MEKVGWINKLCKVAMYALFCRISLLLKNIWETAIRINRIFSLWDVVLSFSCLKCVFNYLLFHKIFILNTISTSNGYKKEIDLCNKCFIRVCRNIAIDRTNVDKHFNFYFARLKQVIFNLKFSTMKCIIYFMQRAYS